MTPRRLIAIVLLMSPIGVGLLWHLCSRALPMDDAANHAVTALNIAEQFHQGFWHGALAAVTERGLRPIIFPLIAVPFLLLTGNNVIAACAAALLVTQAALTVYLYRLARLLSADPLIAAAGSTAVLSMPVVAYYSLEFWSESVWMFLSIACVYHLLLTGPFKRYNQSAAAGIYAGLMIAIRPAESSIILGLLLVFIMFGDLRSRALSLRSTATVLALFAIPVLLLVLSTWLTSITRFEIWAACSVASAVAIYLTRRTGASFAIFATALVSIGCLWWAGFMPAFAAWAHVVTSWYTMAPVTTMDSAAHIVEALRRQIKDYGEVQMAFIAVAAIFSLWSVTGERRNLRPIPRGNRSLLYAAMGSLAVFMVLFSFLGSDRRRSTAAIVLLAIVVIITAANRSRLILGGIFCLIFIQLTVMASALAGNPRWAAANGFGIPVPKRDLDGNVQAANILARYVSQGSTVAVYTETLSSAPARIYEPAALYLALREGNYNFTVGYVWDIGSYEGMLSRLRGANYKYLLLDMFSAPALAGSHEPYVQFTADLVRRMQAPEPDTPGLRMIARFQLENRGQVLFRILPEGAEHVANNLASEFNGATAVASEQQTGYPAANLNDGTEAAWGSQEGTSDVYAGVLLPEPHTATVVRLRLFTPNGRAHAHIVRIVAGDGDTPSGPQWHVIRSRIKGAREFALTTTIPLLPDNSWVSIELDRSDPLWKARRLWGIACLRSQGDLPNYLSVGTGFYLREIEVE